MTNKKVWLTSDTHFSHKNIISYCNRPYLNIHEMNQGMIDNWNSVIGPNDLVYHLGDFSMHERSVKKYLDQLNGIKILVRGNHDENSILNEFDGYAHRIIIQHEGEFIELVHDPAHLSGKTEYAFCGHVHEKWLFMKKGQEMIEVHHGQKTIDIYHSMVVSFGTAKTNILNVGMDVHNMMPITITTAFEMLKNKISQ